MRKKSLFLITHNKNGNRLYILGFRIHHGLFGTILAALGITLVLHDWKDRPWRIKDLS